MVSRIHQGVRHQLKQSRRRPTPNIFHRTLGVNTQRTRAKRRISLRRFFPSLILNFRRVLQTVGTSIIRRGVRIQRNNRRTLTTLNNTNINNSPTRLNIKRRLFRLTSDNISDILLTPVSRRLNAKLHRTFNGHGASTLN